MADEAAARPVVSVKSEWVLVGIVSLVAASLHLWEILEFPLAYASGKITLPGTLMAIAVWLGQGLWITMDRRRNGLEVGAWRFYVLLTGPSPSRSTSRSNIACGRSISCRSRWSPMRSSWVCRC